MAISSLRKLGGLVGVLIPRIDPNFSLGPRSRFDRNYLPSQIGGHLPIPRSSAENRQKLVEDWAGLSPAATSRHRPRLRPARPCSAKPPAGTSERLEVVAGLESNRKNNPLISILFLEQRQTLPHTLPHIFVHLTVVRFSVLTEKLNKWPVRSARDRNIMSRFEAVQLRVTAWSIQRPMPLH